MVKKTNYTLWNIAQIISVFLLILLLVHLAIYGLTCSYITFDGGWNAQVSRNYAYNDKYAVTYPAESTFYLAITTGQTLLLPTALIYRCFGVSFLTTSIVPVFFSLVFLAVTFLVLKREYVLFMGRFSKEGIKLDGVASLLACLSVWILYFIIHFQSYYSFDLCGEPAALAFIIIQFYFMQKYLEDGLKRHIFLSGFFALTAILTKLITVCLETAVIVIMLVLIIKWKKFTALFMYLAGAICSIFMLDTFFKLSQFDMDLNRYITWWKQYFDLNVNMNQGGKTWSLTEKITKYSTCFGQNTSISILVLLLAFFILLVIGILGIFTDKWLIPKILFIMGSGGTGYIMFMLFIGGGDSIFERRMYIHFTFYIIFLIAGTMMIISNAVVYFKEHKRNAVILEFISAVAIILMVSAFSGGIKNVKGFAIKKSGIRERQERLYKEALKLPSNAVCITKGWQFASEITTLCGIPVIETEKIDFNSDVEYYYISDDYLIEDILNDFNYTVVYRKNKDTLLASIVHIDGYKNAFEKSDS